MFACTSLITIMRQLIVINNKSILESLFEVLYADLTTTSLVVTHYYTTQVG